MQQCHSSPQRNMAVQICATIRKQKASQRPRRLITNSKNGVDGHLNGIASTTRHWVDSGIRAQLVHVEGCFALTSDNYLEPFAKCTESLAANLYD